MLVGAIEKRNDCPSGVETEGTQLGKSGKGSVATWSDATVVCRASRSLGLVLQTEIGTGGTMRVVPIVEVNGLSAGANPDDRHVLVEFPLLGKSEATSPRWYGCEGARHGGYVRRESMKWWCLVYPNLPRGGRRGKNTTAKLSRGRNEAGGSTFGSPVPRRRLWALIGCEGRYQVPAHQVR